MIRSCSFDLSNGYTLAEDTSAGLCSSDVNDFFQPLGGGRDILKDRPKLLSWKSRVQSALGDSFDDAHGVLYRLRDKAKL